MREVRQQRGPERPGSTGRPCLSRADACAWSGLAIEGVSGPLAARRADVGQRATHNVVARPPIPNKPRRVQGRPSPAPRRRSRLTARLQSRFAERPGRPSVAEPERSAQAVTRPGPWRASVRRRTADAPPRSRRPRQGRSRDSTASAAPRTPAATPRIPRCPWRRGPSRSSAVVALGVSPLTTSTRVVSRKPTSVACSPRPRSYVSRRGRSPGLSTRVVSRSTASSVASPSAAPRTPIEGSCGTSAAVARSGDPWVGDARLVVRWALRARHPSRIRCR